MCILYNFLILFVINGWDDILTQLGETYKVPLSPFPQRRIARWGSDCLWPPPPLERGRAHRLLPELVSFIPFGGIYHLDGGELEPRWPGTAPFVIYRLDFSARGLSAVPCWARIRVYDSCVYGYSDLTVFPFDLFVLFGRSISVIMWFLADPLFARVKFWVLQIFRCFRKYLVVNNCVAIYLFVENLLFWHGIFWIEEKDIIHGILGSWRMNLSCSLSRL